MLRRLYKISLLFLCGWLLSGPVALLQVGAWGWMIASYSQKSSFEQALAETFGDERPCDVCVIIDAVEQSESGGALDQNTIKDIKLMLGLSRAVQLSLPGHAYRLNEAATRKPENAFLLVPAPPPREA